MVDSIFTIMKYISYSFGDFPIILTVPHDGKIKFNHIETFIQDDTYAL